MTAWESQLDTLVTERGRALVGYAYLLCGDRGTAEDLVQDALVATFSRLRPVPRSDAAHGAEDVTVRVTGSRSVRAIDDLEAYVRRSILNAYLDQYRRRRRWGERRHRAATPDRVAGHDDAAAASTDVARALAALTPRQRACVVLRWFEDLTVPQVARELGIAEGTVKRHLHDSMHVMKSSLGEDAR